MHRRLPCVGLLTPALFALGVVGPTALAAEQVVRQFDRCPVNPADEAYIFTPDGFDKEGNPAVAEGDRVGHLKVTVRDRATGKPTFCRVNVVGADGNYYEPAENALKPYGLRGAWPKTGKGNRSSKGPIRYFGRFFYTSGAFAVAVPVGAVRVEVWKGFEYDPQVLTTQIAVGQTQSVELTLERTVPMATIGYYSGEPHVHMTRKTDEDDERIFDLMEAEDLRYAVLLCYNPDLKHYAGRMDAMHTPQFRGLGAASIRTRGAYSIMSGQEYRSTHYGHVNLYLRDRPAMEGADFDPSTWPVFGRVGRETQEQGGHAFYAHGGYAQEIYADFVQGTVTGVELLQFGIYRGIGLDGWYRILNIGYRFPAFGGSDYPACRKLADCRTYVHHATAPDFNGWFRSLAEGRSFMTTGPLLLLEVDGNKPGAMIHRSGQGPHRVAARVWMRCEVASVTNLQLVVNGQTVKERVVPKGQGKGSWFELEQVIELTESSWIAARAFARAPSGSPDVEAHTNPVYVYLDGKAPYNEADLDWLVGQLDKQIGALRRRVFDRQGDALAYFNRSRDILMGIRKAGGRPAEAQLPHTEATHKENSMSASGSLFESDIDKDAGTGWDVVILRCRGQGRTLEARVVPAVGMNVCSLTVDGVELLRQPKALEDLPGTAYGVPVLYPTPNRIRDSRFTFGGRTFSYPANERTHFLHGLAHSAAWEADSPTVTAKGAWVTGRLRFEPGSDLHRQFPIAHTITLTVTLQEDGLRIAYTVENSDERELPFGFGIHPWFNYLSERRNMQVWVPATARMATETDKAYALLPTGTLEPLDGHAADLRTPRSIENVFLDDVFFGMTPDKPAGYEDRTTGHRVTLSASADFTHMVVFTPKGVDSFCLENQTCSTDAHNLHAKGLSKESHLQIVAPGKSAGGWVKFDIRR